MKSNTQIQLFYLRLVDFLVSNDVEQYSQLEGYTKSEIEDFELTHQVVFPEAYMLFLTNFAKGEPRFFGGQNFKLNSINIFRETAEKLLQKTLSSEIFVFTEWQG